MSDDKCPKCGAPRVTFKCPEYWAMFECGSYLYASDSVLTRKAACYEADTAALTRRARIAERALEIKTRTVGNTLCDMTTGRCPFLCDESKCLECSAAFAYALAEAELDWDHGQEAR